MDVERKSRLKSRQTCWKIHVCVCLSTSPDNCCSIRSLPPYRSQWLLLWLRSFSWALVQGRKKQKTKIANRIYRNVAIKTVFRLYGFQSFSQSFSRWCCPHRTVSRVALSPVDTVSPFILLWFSRLHINTGFQWYIDFLVCAAFTLSCLLPFFFFFFTSFKSIKCLLSVQFLKDCEFDLCISGPCCLHLAIFWNT